MSRVSTSTDPRGFRESDLHGVSKQAIWLKPMSDQEYGDLRGTIRRPVTHEIQGLRMILNGLVAQYVNESTLRDQPKYWPLPRKQRGKAALGPKAKLSTRAERLLSQLGDLLNDAQSCIERLRPVAVVEIARCFSELPAQGRTHAAFYGPFKAPWEQARAQLIAFSFASWKASWAQADKQDALAVELASVGRAIDKVTEALDGAPYGIRRVLGETCGRLRRPGTPMEWAPPEGENCKFKTLFWLSQLQAVVEYPEFSVKRSRDEAALRNAVWALARIYLAMTDVRPRRSYRDRATHPDDIAGESGELLDVVQAFFGIAESRGAAVPKHRGRVASKIVREICEEIYRSQLLKNKEINSAIR